MGKTWSDAMGALAPFIGFCGIRRTHRENGVGRSEVDVAPELRNGAEAAHGGLIMTLLDSVMASAARSTLADDHGVLTVDMNVAFLAPGRGKLLGEGRVVRGGRSLIFCEGSVRDEAGQLVARASGVFSARRPRAQVTA